jgi:hypothetical protein
MNSDNEGAPPEFTPADLAVLRRAYRANQKRSAGSRWGKLTKEERSKQMRAVAMARWGKRKPKGAQ